MSILGVAQQLIAQSGKRIEFVFTGLRPWEKMHEVLLSDAECAVGRAHPIITHVPVVALSPTDLIEQHGGSRARPHLPTLISVPIRSL